MAPNQVMALFCFVFKLATGEGVVSLGVEGRTQACWDAFLLCPASHGSQVAFNEAAGFWAHARLSKALHLHLSCK